MTTISTTSSLATRDASRSMISRTQVDIAKASTEVSSGRNADVGKLLGASTSRLIDLRRMSEELGTITNTNAIVSGHLQTMQSALGEMNTMAQDFFSTASTAQSSPSGRDLLVADAKSKLDRLTSLLSTTFGGAYLFGGENAGVPPVANYLAQGSSSRAAVSSAFSAVFGVPPDDPSVAGITPAALQTFLSGSFEAEFADPAWGTNFSTASTTSVRSRIAPGEIVETPVSANSKGIRDLMSALVAVIDGGTQQLNAESFAALTSYVSGRTAGAASQIADSQSELGIVQQRVVFANERMSDQSSWLTKSIGTLADVDAAEAATRLSLLSTKLETSYAVTARLQRLSLLNYI